MINLTVFCSGKHDLKQDYIDEIDALVKTGLSIEEATKNPMQQYKLCIRLAGIHLQYGCANYRFKCVGVLLK